MESKILLFDLEVAAERVFIWGGRMYEQNIIKVLKPTYILSYSAKWLDGSIETKGLPDFKGFNKDKQSDKQIVKRLWDLLNQAEVVIGHNSKSFDEKVLNARFAFYGMPPPSPYKSIDTKRVAKQYYRFDSNKLDDLGEFLGLGRKLKHGDFEELWIPCMNGDRRAFKEMQKYNEQDVLLLERIYKHFRPFIHNHPTSVIGEKGCPKCHSKHIKKDGFQYNQTTSYQRYRCMGCRSPLRGSDNLVQKEERPYFRVI